VRAKLCCFLARNFRTNSFEPCALFQIAFVSGLGNFRVFEFKGHKKFQLNSGGKSKVQAVRMKSDAAGFSVFLHAVSLNRFGHSWGFLKEEVFFYVHQELCWQFSFYSGRPVSIIFGASTNSAALNVV